MTASDICTRQEPRSDSPHPCRTQPDGRVQCPSFIRSALGSVCDSKVRRWRGHWPGVRVPPIRHGSRRSRPLREQGTHVPLPRHGKTANTAESPSDGAARAVVTRRLGGQRACHGSRHGRAESKTSLKKEGAARAGCGPSPPPHHEPNVISLKPTPSPVAGEKRPAIDTLIVLSLLSDRMLRIDSL